MTQNDLAEWEPPTVLIKAFNIDQFAAYKWADKGHVRKRGGTNKVEYNTADFIACTESQPRKIREMGVRCNYKDCHIITGELSEEYLCPLHDRRMWQVLAWCTENGTYDDKGNLPKYGHAVITKKEYRWAIEKQSKLPPVERQKLRRKDPPEFSWPPMETAILRAVATNAYQLSEPAPPAA